MFAKSLILAATLALTSEAVKIKSGLSANALAGVNVRALSKAELTALLTATQDQFQQYKQENAKHYITESENTARHTNWLETEAYNQSHNSNENSSATFGHNQFSDMTQEEKDAASGTRKPDNADDEQEEHLLLAKVQNYRGFKVEMTTAEYQSLYDSYWATSTISCDQFNQDFQAADDAFMTRKESRLRSRYTKRRMTDAEFDDYWMRVMQDRTVAQSSIQRCSDDDFQDPEPEPTPDPEPEPQPEPTPDPAPEPTQCSATQSEFKWGDNVVVPIKNQGQCGSCYSFSAMTVLEGALAIATGEQAQSFSEQQVVDCQANYANCYGCNGGWPVSLHQSSRTAPIALTADYPYVATEQACKSPNSSQYVAADSVYYIEKSAAGIKAALCDGPITLTVKAQGPFMSYSGGVMTSADCPYANDLDHAVAAIGWTQMDGQEVLIVRNSWGTWWGDNGYIYMAMDDGNNGLGPCGIYAYPSSATVAL